MITMAKTKSVVKTGKTNLTLSKVNKGHSGEESKVRITGKKA
jgi:hypothetical protein